uniref:gap junction gamma-1 protein-like n=1 Tax=Myxine glutinosa TaxID=7769 RepID=UPI00358E316E
MSWSFITTLLQQIDNHATYVGKIWFTTFLIFRIMLTAVGGETIYYDEQSKFLCNTLQPGCDNVCYDEFAPISHVRFWIFQTIFVSLPSVIYLGFAIHRLARANSATKNVDQASVHCKMPMFNRHQHRHIEDTEGDNEEDPMIVETTEENKNDEKKGKNEIKKHDGRKKIKEEGLMKAYVMHIFARSAFEIGFLFGQYQLYGFSVIDRFVCSRDPCPHDVDCFVSRPTEKSIFLIIMYAVTILCMFLNVWEILHLCCGSCRDKKQKKQLQQQQRKQNENYTNPLSYGHGFHHNTPNAPPVYDSLLKPSQGNAQNEKLPIGAIPHGLYPGIPNAKQGQVGPVKATAPSVPLALHQADNSVFHNSLCPSPVDPSNNPVAQNQANLAQEAAQQAAQQAPQADKSTGDKHSSVWI